MTTVIPAGYLSLLSLAQLFVKFQFQVSNSHNSRTILSVFSDSLPLPPLSPSPLSLSLLPQQPLSVFPPFSCLPLTTSISLPPCRVIYPNCSVPCLKLWTNHYSQSKFQVCMSCVHVWGLCHFGYHPLLVSRCSAHVICNMCILCTLHVDNLHLHVHNAVITSSTCTCTCNVVVQCRHGASSFNSQCSSLCICRIPGASLCKID